MSVSSLRGDAIIDAGISCRMQEMYLIVFLTRYLDLLYSFISVYNSSE